MMFPRTFKFLKFEFDFLLLMLWRLRANSLEFFNYNVINDYAFNLLFLSSSFKKNLSLICKHSLKNKVFSNKWQLLLHLFLIRF